MKYILISLALLISSCGETTTYEKGEWKLLLKNGEEVDYVIPFAIRNNYCVDFEYLHDYKDGKKTGYQGMFYVDKEVLEKVRYFGSAHVYVRYLNGERDTFPICSKEEADKYYEEYLDKKYGNKYEREK